MRYSTFSFWLPYIYSAVVVLGLWSASSYIDYIWYIFGSLIILFILVWFSIVTKKFFHKDQLVIFVSPFVFLLGSIAFIILSDSDFVKNIAILLILGGIFFILRANYFFHWRSGKYEPGSLQTQVLYLNLISFFFISTFFYALEIFLNFNFVWNSLIMFILLLASENQYLYLKRVQGASERWYAGIMAFLLVQVFVVLGILPFLVYVKGVIFLIIYYVATELYHATVRGLWKRSHVIILNSVALLLVIVLLLTTKWY